MTEFQIVDFACDIIEPLLFDVEGALMCHFDSMEVAEFLASKGIESVTSVDDLQNHLTDSPLRNESNCFMERLVFDESLIPTEFVSLLRKENVKVSGEIWVIHKNDADPFPSSPHAHNYGQNVKLHLGNGCLYRKRQHVGTMSRNKLLELRTRVRSIELPALEI